MFGCIVTIVGAERFNINLWEAFSLSLALPERVWSSKKMDPILLNKPRKPIIDGAEMAHRKPIRSSNAAPRRAGGLSTTPR